MSLLPQAPRCYIPDPSAHLDAEEGISHDLSEIPLSSHPRLAESEAALNRTMGYGHKKRGCEKFLLCLINSSDKLFAPSNKCLYSFLWLSEETDPFFGATPYH